MGSCDLLPLGEFPHARSLSPRSVTNALTILQNDVDIHVSHWLHISYVA